MPFYRCWGFDWGRTAIRDRFVSYDFQTFEFIVLNAETILVKKRVRGGDDVPTSITVPTAPVYFVPVFCE